MAKLDGLLTVTCTLPTSAKFKTSDGKICCSLCMGSVQNGGSFCS